MDANPHAESHAHTHPHAESYAHTHMDAESYTHAVTITHTAVMDAYAAIE